MYMCCDALKFGHSIFLGPTLNPQAGWELDWCTIAKVAEVAAAEALGQLAFSSGTTLQETILSNPPELVKGVSRGPA